MMNILEPYSSQDYSDRQIEAARRVMIDMGQVLGAYRDQMVLVGGWTPSLMLSLEEEGEERHIGSIDVDVMLDAEKLAKDNLYADLLQALLNTKRYTQTGKEFQVVARVDLEDGEPAVQVNIDFLAPLVKLKKNRPTVLNGFRVLQKEAFDVALHDPQEVTIEGKTIAGAENSVRWRVVSLEDFLLLKAFAIENRDKPKDVYDFCYVLSRYPGDVFALAAAWKNHPSPDRVHEALRILRGKFEKTSSYGSRQLAQFHDVEGDEADRLANTAHGRVERLLREFDQALDAKSVP